MKVNLMVIAHMQDYDTWLKNAFLPDQDRREKVCNEALTTVAKISKNKAVILMYEVDMDAMEQHMNAHQMKVLEDLHSVTHEIYSFSPV